MGEVFNIKTKEAMMPQAIEQTEHEKAWQDLFAAFAVIKEEAMKPTFKGVGFRDATGRTWSVAALVREADRQFAFARKAASHA